MTPSRLLSRRTLAVVVAIAIVLILIGLAVGNPFPPRSITLATGPAGSAFAEFGEQYRRELARSGVEVRLLATEGGATNLQRLREATPGAAAGFVEGGLVGLDSATSGLASLGTIAMAPLWVFLGGSVDSSGRPAALIGKRIALEPVGSGANVLGRRILALNGIPESGVQLPAMTPEEGARALLAGEVDAAVMLTAWTSPAVQRLLGADGIRLQGSPRADAYLARSPMLYKVILPEGTADLRRNIPPADTPLLAVAASLVIRQDLHPALQYALLDAAAKVHGGPDAFHRPGRFPAAEAIDLPLSKQAEVYYRSGRPFLYSYLPLWLAGPIERLLIILLPLFAVVFPVAHFAPTIFAYLTERRLFRLYGELRMAEAQLEGLEPGADAEGLARALDDLAGRASRLRVPLRYQQRRFILKDHIAEAQARVAARRNSAVA